MICWRETLRKSIWEYQMTFSFYLTAISEEWKWIGIVESFCTLSQVKIWFYSAWTIPRPIRAESTYFGRWLDESTILYQIVNSMSFPCKPVVFSYFELISTGFELIIFILNSLRTELVPNSATWISRLANLDLLLHEVALMDRWLPG